MIAAGRSEEIYGSQDSSAEMHAAALVVRRADVASDHRRIVFPCRVLIFAGTLQRRYFPRVVEQNMTFAENTGNSGF